MASDKKRSNSPTQPPSWLSDLIRENRLFHQGFQNHEMTLREIRLITLENQQLLREFIGPSNNSRTVTANSRSSAQASSSSSHSHQLVAHASSASSVRGVIPATQSITAQRAASRVAALPVPRVNHPVSRANQPIPRINQPIPNVPQPALPDVMKICWLHKQFGQASVNCVEPCSFVAPVMPPAAPVLARKGPAKPTIAPGCKCMST